MESQGIKDRAKELVDHAGDYLDTFYQVNLLKASGKAIKTGSSLISTLIILVLLSLVLLFVSIAVAYWLGNLVHSRVGGFLIVAGAYLSALLLLVATKKTVLLPFLRNFLTKKIHD